MVPVPICSVSYRYVTSDFLHYIMSTDYRQRKIQTYQQSDPLMIDVVATKKAMA